MRGWAKTWRTKRQGYANIQLHIRKSRPIAIFCSFMHFSLKTFLKAAKIHGSYGWWEKIRPSPVEVGSLSHNLQGFSTIPGGDRRISSINSILNQLMRGELCHHPKAIYVCGGCFHKSPSNSIVHSLVWKKRSGIFQQDAYNFEKTMDKHSSSVLISSRENLDQNKSHQATKQ